MNLYYYSTVLGKIGIAEESGCITRLFFNTDEIPQNTALHETDILKEAARQLNAYCAGTLKSFSLPLSPAGSAFMLCIWNILRDIPYGTTVSYKDIAAAAGNPKASRAAGMACNRNPIPIFIPCHRVIGSGGKLTGYRGGLALKQRLLGIEKNG